jgi:hypothetical protein
MNAVVKRQSALVSLQLVCLLTWMAASAPVLADPIPKAQALAACQSGAVVGADTPYGETAAEKQAKKIAFDWNCLSMVEGKVEEAFAKYVSRDWCDHSHLVTSGQKDCGNYDETLVSFKRTAVRQRAKYRDSRDGLGQWRHGHDVWRRRRYFPGERRQAH